MIAGPILPRTAEGLWSVLRSEPQRLERGLRIVRRELVIEGGVMIDALAADAVGRPVLLFAAVGDDDRRLPARIAEAREWFRNNATLLWQVLDGTGVRVDREPRVFVVGFELAESCIERLRRSAEPDVAAFRLEGFYLDGVRHVGAVQVFGGDSVAGDRATRAADAVVAPLGDVGGGTTAALATRLARLLERLDPELRVEGDRYTRTWRLDGIAVLTLVRDARGMFALVPDETLVPLRSERDVVDAFDAATRRYLEVFEADPADVPAATPQTLVGQEPSAALGGGRSRGGADPVLERGLRSAFSQSGQDGSVEVTAEEYESFFQPDL